jgi:hypothetical protein
VHAGVARRNESKKPDETSGEARNMRGIKSRSLRARQPAD